MIETQSIVKRFGRVIAVDHVSFSVPQGAICGFLGPNGAGKTTTIRMVVGAIAPDSGEVVVAGMKMDAASSAARRSVGYLAEESPLQPDLTVDEFMRFRADLYGVARRSRSMQIESALSRCNVREVRNRLCGQLSKGYRQRVGLAAAIVHAPRVLVLDEPTSGLDPGQVLEFRKLLQALRTETTVLLSSHVLAEVEASCDRAVLINSGRVVATGTIDQLRSRGAAAERITLECEADPTAAAVGLPGLAALRVKQLADQWYSVEIDGIPGADLQETSMAIGRKLAQVGIAVRVISHTQLPLETVFHRILSAAGNGAEQQ